MLASIRWIPGKHSINNQKFLALSVCMNALISVNISAIATKFGIRVLVNITQVKLI